VTFRGPLLQAIRRRGATITACAAENDGAVIDALASWGVRYAALPLRRAGLSPRADWRYCDALLQLMREEKPDAVLAYTHKPVIYSALAAARAEMKPRMYAMITGLGFAFIESGTFKQRLAGAVVRFLYRRASRHLSGVIFQNPDDQALFRKLRLVRPETSQIIVRGSGIDLEQFAFAPLGELRNAEMLKTETLKRASETELKTEVRDRMSAFSISDVSISALPIRFLLIARLLGDKGIREYVAAARLIKAQHPTAEFHLVGPTDPNPAAIKLSEVQGWHDEGVIQFHGTQSDVRPFLRDCTVYVLPSYREGTPRTVLEAMAIGRPVITTDAPGCKETLFDAGSADSAGVRQGLNGFLVPVKSIDALVAAMRRFIDDPALAPKMGAEGRRLAEEHYDVHKVNAQIMEFMGLGGGAAPSDAERLTC